METKKNKKARVEDRNTRTESGRRLRILCEYMPESVARIVWLLECSPWRPSIPELITHPICHWTYGPSHRHGWLRRHALPVGKGWIAEQFSDRGWIQFPSMSSVRANLCYETCELWWWFEYAKSRNSEWGRGYVEGLPIAPFHALTCYMRLSPFNAYPDCPNCMLMLMSSSLVLAEWPYTNRNRQGQLGREFRIGRLGRQNFEGSMTHISNPSFPHLETTRKEAEK